MYSLLLNIIFMSVRREMNQKTEAVLGTVSLLLPAAAPSPHLPSLYSESVTESSCCVWYTVPRLLSLLHREPRPRSRPRRPRCPGALCCSGPGWPPGWAAGLYPTGPPGTALPPGPGTSRSLHPENPGEQGKESQPEETLMTQKESCCP